MVDRQAKVVCTWCGGAVEWNGSSWVHSTTGSLYVCKHGKDPKQCCGEDHHCTTVKRVFTGPERLIGG